MENISMKKFLCVLFFSSITCILTAQTYKYNTTSFAYKQVVNGYWTEWSDWEPSHMLVVISLDREVINIYSDLMQEYDIYEYNGEESDPDGGKSLKFNCVNQDGLRCQIRIRVQSDGSKQLYVDFNDVMFVYGIEEKN